MMAHDKNQHGSKAFDMALRGIDVLKDIDLVLAPIRPTTDMVEAGCLAANLSSIQVRLVYEAMVRASIPGFTDNDLF